MILNKEMWTQTDKKSFLDFLESKGRPEKTAWSQNILKTTSPVLAIQTDEMVKIANEIMKGNYKSFLDLCIVDYYEAIALYGMIISRMKSFADFMKYLNVYLDYMNCWAHCDILNFPNLLENRDFYLSLSKIYRNDSRVMVRRLSIFILFRLVKEKELLNTILEYLLEYKDENEYYVIMMAGWLLSECIILYKDETLKFIENNKFNKKIINKGIQKCRESNRLSQEEKDYLLKYKIK